jgi:acyl carrier protein
MIKDINKLYEVINTQGINEILDKYDALDKVDTAVTWFDLNLDDLDCVEFIMNTEAKYNISIDDNLAEQILKMNFSDFYARLNISKIRNDKLNDLGI